MVDVQLLNRSFVAACFLLVGFILYKDMAVTLKYESLSNTTVWGQNTFFTTSKKWSFSTCSSQTLDELVNMPILPKLHANLDVSIFERSGCFLIDSKKLGLYRILNKGNFARIICNTTKKTFLPTKEKEQRTALVSLPGSGNTWVRHLLELTELMRILDEMLTGTRSDFNVDWIQGFQGDMLVLFYEKLKTVLLNSLTRMAAFTKSEVTLTKLWCLLQNQEGLFHREQRPDWMSRKRLTNKTIEKSIQDWKKIYRLLLRDGHMALLVTEIFGHHSNMPADLFFVNRLYTGGFIAALSYLLVRFTVQGYWRSV